MLTVYLVQCEKNKWFIGTAIAVHRAYEKHRAGKGSSQTQKQQPKALTEHIVVASVESARGQAKFWQMRQGSCNVCQEEKDQWEMLEFEGGEGGNFTDGGVRGAEQTERKEEERAERRRGEKWVSPVSTPEHRALVNKILEKYMPPFKLV